jgi:putative transposase
MMQSLDRRYVQYFNCRYKRTGTLWEGRYRATLIDSERYPLTCMRYIELNPVRAGMVKRATEYAWSSHRANARGVPDPLVMPHEIYLRLGRSLEERRLSCRQLFGVPVNAAELETIRETANKAWVLGNDRFCARIEELTGRRATPLRRVRPREAGAEIRADV